MTTTESTTEAVIDFDFQEATVHRLGSCQISFWNPKKLEESMILHRS